MFDSFFFQCLILAIGSRVLEFVMSTYFCLRAII